MASNNAPVPFSGGRFCNREYRLRLRTQPRRPDHVSTRFNSAPHYHLVHNHPPSRSDDRGKLILQHRRALPQHWERSVTYQPHKIPNVWRAPPQRLIPFSGL